jgi:hypothetical protein
MFTVVEIDKVYTLDSAFTPLHPFVYKSVTTVSATSGVTAIADYWTTTFGASGTFNDDAITVESFSIDRILYLDKVDDLATCKTTEESFYFDSTNQYLYIHLPHEYGINSHVYEIGSLFGYCNDTVRYFRDQLYAPILQSAPVFNESADPLQYDMMGFSGGSIVLTNHDELFDADEKLYGNSVRIKRGSEGDDYDDLTLMFEGYVKGYRLTTQDVTFDIGDKRERLQVDYPTTELTILSAYNDTGAAWDTSTELHPDGYGDVVQVPAYPTTDNAGTVTFTWGTSVTSITQVYAYHDGVLTEVAHANFSASGTFTLTDAQCASDGSDPTNGLVEVYVTGRMRDYDNPADIIKDLNDRVADIEYNTTNYDTTEWESEDDSLADIALYMNESRRLYEWYEMMQNGSDPGFRYEDRDKITLRVDDPDRASVLTIAAIDIRNRDIPIVYDGTLYATSCIIKYNKNWRTGRYSQVTNNDYEDDVLLDHKIEKIETYETLLTGQTDAEVKAARITEDMSEIRPMATLRLQAEDYPAPRIYDIVEATVSLGSRAYLGAITGMVMGIEYIDETDEVEITVRSVG